MTATTTYRLPREPKWPIPQLATWELRDYRAALEHALEVDLKRDDLDRIDAQLAKVLEEQVSRRDAERRSRQAKTP